MNYLFSNMGELHNLQTALQDTAFPTAIHGTHRKCVPTVIKRKAGK